MSHVSAMEVRPPSEVAKATVVGRGRCAAAACEMPRGIRKGINVMLNKSVLLLATGMAVAPVACALAAADTPGNAAAPTTGYSAGVTPSAGTASGTRDGTTDTGATSPGSGNPSGSPPPRTSAQQPATKGSHD
jgi:hypothetical protein